MSQFSELGFQPLAVVKLQLPPIDLARLREQHVPFEDIDLFGEEETAICCLACSAPADGYVTRYPCETVRLLTDHLDPALALVEDLKNQLLLFGEHTNWDCDGYAQHCTCGFKDMMERFGLNAEANLPDSPEELQWFVLGGEG